MYYSYTQGIQDRGVGLCERGVLCVNFQGWDACGSSCGVDVVDDEREDRCLSRRDWSLECSAKLPSPREIARIIGLRPVDSLASTDVASDLASADILESSYVLSNCIRIELTCFDLGDLFLVVCLGRITKCTNSLAIA